MRHLLLRAQLGTVPLQTCQWVLTEEAGVSRWQLLSQDGQDTGLRTATRELGAWALWVASASPRAVAEQVRLDDWSDEAVNRLRQAGAVLERLQRRAYRHKETHVVV
ncbi:hypothetical protein [Polaromonas sp. CG9_12]|nr:hypothetical protein [Polaromonas sp. CG9_12]